MKNDVKLLGKKRLMLLLKLMQDLSDENHQWTTNDIINYFEKMGIATDRKTVKSDMELLIEFGYDIVIIAGSPNRFFFGSRTFQIPELKLLIDAVESSKFITAKKTEELVEKLMSFAGRYQSEEIKRNLRTIDKLKPGNEQIYYIVDEINLAINQRRQIKFKYMDYTPTKEKTLRNNGRNYYMSPYSLVWNDDRYYVVGYSNKHKSVATFRVDRMYETKIEKKEIVTPEGDFDISVYVGRVFNMFGGEKINVELLCQNELMRAIIDRFGEEVEISANFPESFIADVLVEVSPTFYSWVFQFDGKVSIKSPPDVKENYNKMLRNALDEDEQ